jgi:hypothetical protein
MENAGICYGHLEYFTVSWHILWPFGNIVVIWYIFPRFGILSKEKSGKPGGQPKKIFFVHRQRNTLTPTWFHLEPILRPVVLKL